MVAGFDEEFVGDEAAVGVCPLWWAKWVGGSLAVMVLGGMAMPPKSVWTVPLSMVVRPMNQEEMPGPVAMVSQICCGVALTVVWWRISNSLPITCPSRC